MSRSISNVTRGSRRFQEILRTLGKYGLADLLGDNLPEAIRDKSARLPEDVAGPPDMVRL